jgi:hypothetical protein
MHLIEFIKIFWEILLTMVTSYGVHLSTSFPFQHRNNILEGVKDINFILNKYNTYIHVDIIYKSGKVLSTTNRGHIHSVRKTGPWSNKIKQMRKQNT